MTDDVARFAVLIPVEYRLKIFCVIRSYVEMCL